MEFVMVILLVIAFIAICIVSKKAKRKRLIEELKQLILACDTEKVPFERVEYFCRENDFTDTEYHEIRKNLYYELANEDDIHALDMAAAYAQNENRAKEINYRIRAAKLGHVWSMHYLGLIYAYGEEYVQFRDSKKSFYWFSKAAELGDEDSVVHVARAYELGEGVEKDEEKAFNILKDYSDRGYSGCSYELAFSYYGSIGSSYYNPKLAEQTYNRLMQRGDPEMFAKAANRLGYFYGHSYIHNSSTDEYSDRRKAAYCFALAHFIDPDLYDTDKMKEVGYRWTEFEMKKWAEDAQNLRYNPM